MDDIRVEDLEEVLDNADTMTLSQSSGANIYLKQIRGRTLAVVADDERNVIITAYIVIRPQG